MVRTVTILLGTAGTLLLLAGLVDLMDDRLATFGGIAAFVLTATLNAIFKPKEKKK
jgi:hypothetical protein